MVLTRSAARTPPPRPQVHVVERPALLAVLDAGAATQVTVVTAPAGSGKTVLVRSWLESRGLADQAAWVSVERGERDPQRFWGALTQAVSRTALETGGDSVPPSPASHAQLLITRLTTTLAALEQGLFVVIDDVHELREPGIVAQLTEFLAGLPRTVRVLLMSRHDLHLGLHRRRLDGDMTEIRIDTLRFTVEETQQLLAGVGIDLSDDGLALLHRRTEGWVAGLRLAALALMTHPDAERFVQEFSGSERTVAEYLVAEVLDRQTPEVRRLLVRTSILAQVNGALGDLLTGDTGTARQLGALADAGTFVIPLDAHGEWFRFHHLFGDLLGAQLRHAEAPNIPSLHLLAADWYAENGDIAEAIGHALAADGHELATDMLLEHYFSLVLDGRQATARGLVERAARHAPTAELAVLRAADELIDGSLERAHEQLALASRLAGEVPDARRPRFDLMLYVSRLALARRLGDYDSVLDTPPPPELSAEPRSADDLSRKTDVRAWVLMNLGIVEVWTGRLDEGERHLVEAGTIARHIRRPYLQTACLAHQALSVSWRSAALATPLAHEAIALAQRSGLGDDPVAGVAHVVLGHCRIATGDIAAAQQELLRADQTLRVDLDPAAGSVLHTGRALLQLIDKRFRDARHSFEEAERLGQNLVVSLPLALASKGAMAYSAVLAGEGALADQSLAALTDAERDSDEVRVVIAAQAIARGDAAAALAALDGPLDQSPKVHRAMIRVRALLLEATARYLLDDEVGARAAVESALDLAEVDVMILPFLWAGSAELLQRHHRHDTAHGAFLALLLDVLSRREAGRELRFSTAAQIDLSDTELRVLRFLPSNLTAGEIAGELYLSVNTIKTHLRSIYTKLDAHSRSEAVAHARDLGLMGRSPSSR